MTILALTLLSLGHSALPADVPRQLTLASDSAPAQPSASFDFALLPEHQQTPAEVLAGQELDHKLRVRRTMLELHQAAGIVTAAALAATVLVGTLSYIDKFDGGNTGKFEVAHDYLEAGATATFIGAGLLALLAPVPVAKKSHGLDTITIHKYAMLAATAGYAAEIVLGILTVSMEGHLNQQALGEAHLITGYATLAAEGTGVGVLFFP